MDTTQDQVETGLLTPLFEARLQYQSDMDVVVSAETREGELVGSGDGRVSGDLLGGKARWSMYEGLCAYIGCSEPGLSRHSDKISALAIRLVPSQRMMVLKYGLMQEDMDGVRPTRATHRYGYSRWPCNFRQQTSGTSG